MTKEKLIFVLLGILILTSLNLIFIKQSNNHEECNNVITYSKNVNGENVKFEKHECKERFNF
jgi:hypothetical protein